LMRVLAYPKFGLKPNEILPIMTDYKNYAHTISTISTIDKIELDPTDNIFLECAVDGYADYIISGDHHLLELKEFDNIPIVTAVEFLTLEKLI
jgi:uncharacterized protein